jgi:membrane protein DedA with SNARE-associated domain
MELLTALMSVLAASSLMGVLGVTLLERLVPILPSYLLLLSIGIAAAQFDGSVTVMALASLVGSLSGCGIYFCAASRIGAARNRRWGRHLARVSGVSRRRMRRLLVAFRRNAPLLSLISQLVPGVRLVAPGLAGAIGIPAVTYFPFAAIGIAIWNLFFIAAGYVAGRRNPHADAASIALVVIGIVLGIEAAIGALWWAWCRYRRRVGPARLPAAALGHADANAIVE